MPFFFLTPQSCFRVDRFSLSAIQWIHAPIYMHWPHAAWNLCGCLSCQCDWLNLSEAAILVPTTDSIMLCNTSKSFCSNIIPPTFILIDIYVVQFSLYQNACLFQAIYSVFVCAIALIRILTDVSVKRGKRKKRRVTCGGLQLLSDLEESYNR